MSRCYLFCVRTRNGTASLLFDLSTEHFCPHYPRITLTSPLRCGSSLRTELELTFGKYSTGLSPIMNRILYRNSLLAGSALTRCFSNLTRLHRKFLSLHFQPTENRIFPWRQYLLSLLSTLQNFLSIPLTHLSMHRKPVSIPLTPFSCTNPNAPFSKNAFSFLPYVGDLRNSQIRKGIFQASLKGALNILGIFKVS